MVTNMIKTMLHGLSMALADSVPGVSGGTVAYIVGFYERLLTAIHDLFDKDGSKRKNAIYYLIKFALGWGIGMVASILLLASFFESNIYFMSSLFLGLTVSAVPFVIYEERNTLKGKYGSLFFTLVGIAVVVLMCLLRSGGDEAGAVDFAALSPVMYLYLLVSGAFAITAMLLPGISGSTLLLILGLYVPAVGAVKEVLHLNFGYLPGVAALAVGALIGVIAASGLIKKGLERFRPQMVYLIIGLMLGSLYAIAVGPETLSEPKPPLSVETFRPLAFILGLAILCGLEFIKHCEQKKSC